MRRATRERAAGAVLAGLLLAAAPAGAAEPRPAAPPEAGLGKKTAAGPDASLAGSLEGRKAAPQAGPRLEFEQFRYAVEVQVSGKRREEMADLGKLIRLGGSQQELPDWLFRLAELHWEEAQYFFFEANRRDDQLAALGPKPQAAAVDRLRAEKKELEGQSREQQEHAIRLYRDVARRWPAYPRLDEVLFFLGENLWKRNQREEALKAYRALITRFEKSRYVPDAWMAFGEFYFDQAEKSARNDNLKKALESYRRAAAYTASSIYGYALYKQGWVHYNLGRWNDALDLFRGVILFGELPTSTIAPEKKIALVREAKKDYVRTYSHVGSAQAAREDFQRIGGDGWRDMLRSLAGLYYEEGKDREAVAVYHQLIQHAPLDPEAPLFQSRIVTCAGRMGRKDLAVQQAQVFVKMLRDIEAAGGGKDEKGKKALADARADAENTLRTLAVNYHTEYRKTRDEPVARLAAEVYATWIDLFPQAPQAYQMRFFQAELLFALERYQQSGDAYASVARIDAGRMAERPPKPGKYFADALEGAIHSYDFVARKAEGQGRRPAAGAAQPQPIAKEKQQLLDACEAYLKWQPAGAKRVEIAYKAADVYYRHNRFAEAVKLFSGIALEHPRHEVAAYAANLVLDCHNLQGDWRGMSAWAQRFWREGELIAAHPALKDDLARVIEQSAFKVVEELEKERRYAAAADAYLAFAREWPASKLAPTALFNASVDLAHAGQLERTLEVRDRLLQAYPGDALAAKVVHANALDHEAAGDFEKAAEDSERYFAAWKKQQGPPPRPAQARGKGRKAPPPEPARPAGGPFEEQKAQDALYNAGVFREGLSQYKRAEADRQLFVETWPGARETPKVFLSIADLHGKAGARAAEVRQLEEYQRRWGQAPEEWLAMQARIVRAWDKAGNRDAARRARQAALAFYRQRKLSPQQAGERGLPPVAEGMLIELEAPFASWDRITLDVKPKYLKSQLQVKGVKLLDLEKQYGAIVQLKQAEAAVCALTRIGSLYDRMARTLVDAPVPKELRGNKEFVKEYRAQLAAFAEAPRAKAVEGMEIALAKSRELGVRNDCAREADGWLARASPEKYGPVLEKVPEAAAPAPRERLQGYGLLAGRKSWEAPRAPASAAPAPAAGRARPAPAPAPSLPADDRPPVAQPGEPDDEDLPR